MAPDPGLHCLQMPLLLDASINGLNQASPHILIAMKSLQWIGTILFRCKFAFCSDRKFAILLHIANVMVSVKTLITQRGLWYLIWCLHCLSRSLDISWVIEENMSSTLCYPLAYRCYGYDKVVHCLKPCIYNYQLSN